MKTLPPLIMSLLSFIAAGIMLYANGGTLEAGDMFKVLVILSAVAVGVMSFRAFIRFAAWFSDWAAWNIHEMLDNRGDNVR